MVRYRIYQFSGYLSLLIGVSCATSVYLKHYLFYGIALSVLGFFFSLVNILLNAKYEFAGEKYPRGYWGLFFSSFPVVFFIVMFKLGR